MEGQAIPASFASPVYFMGQSGTLFTTLSCVVLPSGKVRHGLWPRGQLKSKSDAMQSLPSDSNDGEFGKMRHSMSRRFPNGFFTMPWFVVTSPSAVCM